MRKGKIRRQTKETKIEISLNIDGSGESDIKTPINFLNHMLENFSRHGLIDIKLKAKGDTHIDQHHLIEDLGISLGQAIENSLKEFKGINRTGFFAFPMDEALGIIAIDLGGRTSCVFQSKFKRRTCGDLDTDLVEDFFIGFSQGLNCNVAVFVPYGRNDHHKIEAIFKGFGKSLQMAVAKNSRIRNKVLSTKEYIERLKNTTKK